MICLNTSRECKESSETGDTTPGSRIYDRRFWLASISNFCTAVTVAILFRYADLIERLGGGELELGWIVGVGMSGSIVIRFILGHTIDRHGARRVWLVSLAVLATTCFAHLLLSSCHGLAIYALRILFVSSVAGVFGSSLTWVGSRVPRHRLAETIGALGASGFVAWALGNFLGDLLSRGPYPIETLFIAAGLFAILAMGFCLGATAGYRAHVDPTHGSMVRLLWRHSSRVVLLVGVGTGLAIGLPGTFLRTFTAELGITTMGLFFAVYAAVALTVRISSRRFPERFGLAPVILLGLVLMCLGLLSFLLVKTTWQLAIPAAVLGCAHAIVFPPTIAASTLSFPEHCRGLGTMLILAAYDLGILIGSPLSGAIIGYSGQYGLAPYPTMFITIASLLGLISLVFMVSFAFHRVPAVSREPASPVEPESHPKQPIALPECTPVR